MSTQMKQFSDLTLKVTKSLTKTEKKAFGIFISPGSIIDRLNKSIIDHLGEHKDGIKNILEPSCGTCEIVNYCDSNYTNVVIDAVEYNKTVFESVKDLTFKNTVNLINADFIQYNPNKRYDLIIGNPPYFVCKKSDVPEEYEELIHGRPNIFGLFILHSLSMLNAGGILAFIVPKSFLNSLYYSKIRNFIKETCTIIKIDDYSDLNHFIDTEQSTFGLIIKKNTTQAVSAECNYSMLFNDNYIFTDNSTELKELFEGSTTLEKMGLKARTGQVVWNEHKDELTDDEEETILIYNSNISSDNKFVVKEFKNDEKKQYINRDGRIDPVLVVNRGNGNSAYKLNYALIEKGPFVIENHLNEIYSPKKMEKKKLMEIYNKIINSFKNQKTKKFIELFLGNNGLSKTELETIFPIYDV
jgi:adenine-specific DNA-methyltransferase